MKERIAILVLILMLIVGPGAINVEAKEDKRLEELCIKKSSYELNKQECDTYLASKNTELQKDAKVDDIESKSEEDLRNAVEVAKLYNESKEQYDAKVKELKELKAEIKKLNKKIITQEDDLFSRLEYLSTLNNENLVIDFVMGASDLDELMIRVATIESLNSFTIETLGSLERERIELEEKQSILEEEEKRLKETNKKLEVLLVEFRQKEATLYSTATASSAGGAVNPSLIGLKDTDFVSYDAWGRPLASGVVTAVSWYYPASFGGAWHPGGDFATLGSRTGVPVTAPANGAVLTSGVASGYGNYLVTIHEKNGYVYTIIYGHLQSIANVNSFKKGDTIAYVGMTGITTGPHVHIEVLQHNTNDVQTVINNYSKRRDYWFGLGYNSIGSCDSVCRLHPAEQFGLGNGQRW